MPPRPARPAAVAAPLLLALSCLALACTEDATPGDTAVDAATVDTVQDATDEADAGPADAEPAGTDATPETVADVAPDAAGPCQTDADCPASANACQPNKCQPGFGCVAVVLLDGAVCDDGEPCTLADTCQAGTCQAGSAKNCDDGLPCTSDACGTDGACSHTPADGGACDDGNPCTADDVCQAGECAGTLSVCPCQANADCQGQDDGNACNGTLYCDKSALPYSCKVNPATVVTCPAAPDPCQVNACAPATGACGLQPAADGTVCDDGSPCTTGDVCAAGQCQGGTNTCLCSNDAECAAQDDGNLCNGTMFCNKASGKCEVNPATVVSCPSVDDTACSQNACQPKTGQCAMVAVDDKLPCSDGDPCTVGDACAGGQCAPGTNTCSCQQDADCAALDDGNLCNGTLFCAKASGKCQLNPATVVTCPSVDDTACSQNTCDPKTGQCGFVALPDATTCDADGNGCTADDQCQAGQCVADTNVCDCQKDADCAAKEDGDLCNGTLYCNKAKHKCEVNPATVVFCPYGLDTACSANTCVPATGKCAVQAVNENGACDADGNPCTVQDTCQAGQCVADANVCDCQQNAECTAKEDGNPCNGTLYCEKTNFKCEVNPATVVTCPSVDDTTCTQNRCQPATGQCAPTKVNQGRHCDGDGNVCTLYDTCKDGQCQVAANLCECGFDGDCGFDDGDKCNGTLYCDKAKAPFVCLVNPTTIVKCPGAGPQACVVPTCQPGSGQCAPQPGNEGKACDDGDECTADDSCQAGACAGKAQSCDDGDVCTLDTCEAATGVCKHKADPCSDGNTCTNDTCDAGKGGCQHTAASDGSPCAAGACVTDAKCAGGTCQGVAKGCDDGEACTTDTCDESGSAGKPDTEGCVHTPLADGAKCSDGTVCTSKDACLGAKCAGSPVLCPGGAPCVACDPVAGCVDTTAPCEDGNVCTESDACKGGACAGGAAKVCDDGNSCTSDSCDPGEGCVSGPGPIQCNDGDACTTGEVCKSGNCGNGAPVACDDGLACTTDQCDAKLGCVFTPDAAACDDGLPCTQDVCDVGQKKCVHPTEADGTACGGDHQCHAGFCKWASAVSAGQSHTCALKPGGAVVCWGSNSYGQLGVGQSGGIPQTTAIAVKDLADAVAVVAGVNHTCALRQTGQVACWGYNLNGQLGTGEIGSQVHLAKAVQGLGDATAIASGYGHFCAVRKTGHVACWGKNDHGQVGTGATSGVVLQATDVQDPGAGDGKLGGVVEVALGSDHTCARLGTGAVRCWGRNAAGQCAQAKTQVDVLTPSLVPGLTAQALTASDYGTCALRTDGTASCWGKASDGQRGDGTVTTLSGNEVPSVVQQLQGALAIDAGVEHVCARTKSSQVACWGGSSAGQVGNGGAGFQLFPAVVEGVDHVAAVSAGGQHTCALSQQGEVRCWGGNDLGELGHGVYGPGTEKALPVQVNGSTGTVVDGCQLDGGCDDGDVCTTDACDPKTGTCTHLPAADGLDCGGGRACAQGICKWAVALASGDEHTCALRANGTVSCWGAGDSGQLGNGQQGGGVFKASPVDVVGLQGAKALTANASSTCALLQDGTARCWGANTTCQLGNGDETQAPSDEPVPVQGLSGAKGLALGRGHACAILADGKGACWGEQAQGALGNGSTAAGQQCAPVPVNSTATFSRIVAGEALTVTTGTDPNNRTWGSNAQGALGSGNSDFTFKSAVPVLASYAQIFPSIAAGRRHACQTTLQGYLQCWGDNTQGQVGYSKTQFAFASPVGLPDFGSAKLAAAVFAGYQHTCVAAKDGTAWCFGLNDHGQVGNGKTETAWTPAQVQGLTGVVALAPGRWHTCALSGTGDVQCWGRNDVGQLGNGKFGGAAGSLQPQAVTAPPAQEACKLASTCDDGNPCTVDVCDPKTGACSHPAAPDGPTPSGGKACANPTHVCAAGACKMPQIQAIAAGASHTCGVTTAGNVLCWGYNNAGQAGTGEIGVGGDLYAPAPPTLVKEAVYGVALGQVTHVAARGSHTCAVTAPGHVYCWGSNVSGSAGTNTDDSAYTKAVKAVTVTDAKALAVGDETTCVVRKDGTAQCWGGNAQGQLGGGDFVTPQKLGVQVLNLTGATALGAAQLHTCGLTGAGQAWCWGVNGGGQLGQGQANVPAKSATPLQVTGLADALQIAAGAGYVCAARKTGALACWGGNSYGQLGIGSLSTTPAPKAVTFLTDAVQVAAYDLHTCAATTSGKAFCWGNGNDGKLGPGSLDKTIQRPVRVPLDRVQAVATGIKHSCALRADGAVWCWGDDASGQLGDGVKNGKASAVPVLVPGTAAK